MNIYRKTINIIYAYFPNEKIAVFDKIKENTAFSLLCGHNLCNILSKKGGVCDKKHWHNMETCGNISLEVMR